MIRYDHDYDYDFLGDLSSKTNDDDDDDLLDYSNSETTFTSETYNTAAASTIATSTLTPYNNFTQSQENTLVWVGRICSIVSIFGGFYIFYWAWRRKQHVYHRLMMGKF